MKRNRITATQFIALGFIGLIIVGALLLTLPISNKDHHVLSFFDALFTATSATCVTGLVVRDTWTQFTVFGQAIILLLIQTGGLGFMSVAMFFSLALGKKIGLRERSVLMESVSSLHIGGVVLLVKRALIGTAMFEGAGAILLAIRFCPIFGLKGGIWYSIFHAVSAFCNAGFDLMGCYGQYASLMPFAGDPYVNIIIMLLIITGGIGFLVWQDIYKNKLHFSKYMLHTKIMLVSTFLLIFVPALFFFIIEDRASFMGMNVGKRVLASFFQAVTARTAGFNTVDYARMSGGSTLISVFLMMIGAGAGSTAGGMKVTTFAAIILSVIARAKGKSEVEIFGRRLDAGQTRSAFCSAAYYILLAFLGCFIILLRQDLPIKDVIFEVFSAIGTVGLTTGITRALAPLSRFVIILLMYSGRMGSISVVMAVTERKNANLQNPVEKIIVG